MDIKITKGLNIKLVGEADHFLKDAPNTGIFSVYPSDFWGITPKLLVKEGEEVKAGSPLFFSKEFPEIKICSPVSGKISAIVRGEKRRILRIEIESSASLSYLDIPIIDVNSASADDLKKYFLDYGLWPFIEQRPYAIIARPHITPKHIFISGYDSAPLAPDLDYALKGKENFLQAAINALSKMTTGKVHLSLSKETTVSPLLGLKNVEYHTLKGPHPVGNVSTQIAKISPINKGEVVWVVRPNDLVIIGEALLNGKFNMERVISLSGSGLKQPHYIRTIAGNSYKNLLKDNMKNDKTYRIIDGNVLTGKTASMDGNLGYFTNQVCVIPEGNDYDFLGWQLPRSNKFSVLKAGMFSWLTPGKKYDLNTNTNGEHRAFVMTGMYEKVMPLDIYPMQLLKACLTKNIEKMEDLGLYEVAPEDFALTEFVDVSKQDHQKIIREALDYLYKEVGV